MTVLVSAAYCFFFMLAVGLLFLGAYKVGMGTFSLKNCLHKFDYFVIVFASIATFSICLWSLLKNEYVYYWDYGGYWTDSYKHMQNIFSNPKEAFTNLYYSVCFNDYNLILPTLIALPLQLFGYSFVRYVMVNFTFFLLPAMLIMFAISWKLMHKASASTKHTTAKTTINANQGLNFPNAMVNIANATRPKICRSRP